MKIKVFVESAGTFDEREILYKFAQGISSCGSRFDVKLDIGQAYSPCDVAVILGSWKARDKAHHVIRTSVATESKCFVVIETALLGRRVFQPNSHHRIGVNGYLNNAGKFYTENCNTDRLHDLGINWSGWQNDHDGNILLLLQLPGDASLRGINVYDWAVWAVTKIRQHTDRPIRVRTHPSHNPKEGDEFHQFVYEMAMAGNNNISFSLGKNTTLAQELSQSFCTVAFSSGSSIDSILAGVPTIACDPANFAFEVSSNYIEEIENPRKSSAPTILQWLSNLAYSQWTTDEMRNGTAWYHLVPIIDSLPQVPRGKK